MELLELLGRDAMSSEESIDGEQGVKQTRVLVKDWRSYSLVGWLRDLHGIWERLCMGRGADKGVKSRHRSYTSIVQRRSKPRPGLPRNAYSEQWLEGLSEYERNELRIDEKEFNFLHKHGHPIPM